MLAPSRGRGHVQADVGEADAGPADRKEEAPEEAVEVVQEGAAIRSDEAQPVAQSSHAALGAGPVGWPELSVGGSRCSEALAEREVKAQFLGGMNSDLDTPLFAGATFRPLDLEAQTACPCVETFDCGLAHGQAVAAAMQKVSAG